MREIIFIILASAIFMSFQSGCETASPQDSIGAGAERTAEYIPLIRDKNVAVVANHSSFIGETHLVDTLLSLNIKLVKIFSPEHGFRGRAPAGELLYDSTDLKTGLPVISLYGKRKKPQREDLRGVDIVIFDIQDVGVRFYTYFSTMHYVMEACAENNIGLIIFDRPNPNGFYVDGPVLEMKYRSFVGMHPTALVHGMTAAEYARMINEEGWLKNGIKCKLQYVLCKNYTHSSCYILPTNPSPNIQSINAVYLYPSLGLFEGTVMNVGRGTDFPFEAYGHPFYKGSKFSYTPKENAGAKYPKYQGEECYGVDLRDYFSAQNLPHQVKLGWLLDAYHHFPAKAEFFNDFFKYLAGNELLESQVKQGMSEDKIRESWQQDIEHFKSIRKKYLLYPDFE